MGIPSVRTLSVMVVLAMILLAIVAYVLPSQLSDVPEIVVPTPTPIPVSRPLI